MQKAKAAVVRAELAKARAQWGWSPSDIISLLRGGGSSGKGSGYERELCKHLSLWWTDNARDDIFWRSSGSGARAKVRGRRGAATAGQHGDVAATDPIGAPFIRLFTVEAKRGYSEYTMQDLIDRPDSAGVQMWEQWFAQAAESHAQAGSYAWLLITRRDRRVPLIWHPYHLLADLREHGAFAKGYPRPLLRMSTTIRCLESAPTADTVGAPLDTWLAAVPPAAVKQLGEAAK